MAGHVLPLVPVFPRSFPFQLIRATLTPGIRGGFREKVAQARDRFSGWWGRNPAARAAITALILREAQCICRPGKQRRNFVRFRWHDTGHADGDSSIRSGRVAHRFDDPFAHMASPGRQSIWQSDYKRAGATIDDDVTAAPAMDTQRAFELLTPKAVFTVRWIVGSDGQHRERCALERTAIPFVPQRLGDVHITIDRLSATRCKSNRRASFVCRPNPLCRPMASGACRK